MSPGTSTCCATTIIRSPCRLEGNAVTEGGQVDENGDLTVDGSQVTWRVESDLRNVVIETGDIIVGGSGEYYPIVSRGWRVPVST